MPWSSDSKSVMRQQRNRLEGTASITALVLALMLAVPAHADGTSFTQRNTFGEAGLLDMPDARMAPDGQLSFTVSFAKYAQRGVLGFQILPWLEGTFRYTRLPLFATGRKTDYDRSFGLKLRLFEEDVYMPELSVGIRDAIGTGIYGAEYIVASKQFWDFDVTAGLGWGRLAGDGTFDNPFGEIFQSFKTRKSAAGVGGTVDFGQFFHGPDMGLFGGVTWHTPIENLNLTLEYSSDKYLDETRKGNVKIRTPINIGITYQPFERTTIGAGWFYGTAIGGTLSFALDPGSKPTPVKLGNQPTPVAFRSDEQQANALTALVDSMNGVGAPEPIVGPQRAAALLPNAPSNMEVDGRMLLVDVHASGRAGDYCKDYAWRAAASNSKIESIAVTDLDDSSGKVAICDAPGADGGGHVTAVSVQLDDASAGGAYGAADLAVAQSFDLNAAKQKIRDDMAAQSLRLEAISISGQQITVYYSNSRYEFEAEALGRLVRVLMADTPPSVEIFRLVPVYFGRPSQDVQVFRAPLERMFEAHGTTLEMHSAIGLRPAPLDNPLLDSANESSYPRVSWAISPAMRQGLFEPASLLRVQIFAALDGSVTLLPGIAAEARYELNLYNTFAGAVASNSVLPHVRSDFARYLSDGKNGVSDLDLVYRGRIAPDIFMEAKVGYLEDMFAGAGGQILWRPEGGRWALGGDIYEVWQRDFNRLFGLQRYHILTGHVSIYYQSPWHGINVNLHAGHYLAGDNGLTVEVSRRFDTGVEIGAFATFTNVPFAKFGEGSFDKGITIHIPLEWALPFSTQSSYDLALRPLTRDGGQRLAGDDSLYTETRRTSFDEITEHADDIAYP